VSVVGKFVRGKAYKVRCDGCGRLSSDPNGYYFDKALNRGGTISGKGRECEHDFCRECEAENPSEDECPKCGWKKELTNG
jgi:ribosomal protein L37E